MKTGVTDKPAGGRENPLVQPMSADLQEYLHDESRSSGQADSISFPRNESEIRSILQELHARGTRITIQGARTGLTAAAVPNGGHILNLMRCCRVTGLRINSRNRFCVRVQPGITLQQLRRQIETRDFDPAGWDDESLQAYAALIQSPRQFFSPDPTESTASLGGMAACNASGARSFCYGPIRRHITALRVVLADGQTLALHRGDVTASGRDLVLETEQHRLIPVRLPTYQLPAAKSASGYHAADNMDALDLFIGSDGTLGVISELELELLPLPSIIWGVMFLFSEEPAAIDFVVAARDDLRLQPEPGAVIAALEYFDENVLAILRRQKQENPSFAQFPVPGACFRCAIYVELHACDEDQVCRLLIRLSELFCQAGGSESDTWLASTELDYDRMIQFRHAAPESVNRVIDQRRQAWPAITKLGTDMSVPDQHLRRVLAMYRQSLLDSGLEFAAWGHIGDNHVHVNILPRDSEDYRQGKALYRSWAVRVVQLGGSVSAEHGIGKLKTEFLALMFGAEHIAEMADLKKSLDPKGLFGIGNLFAWKE
jgi:D-lactate dehydrogenase (cytochrome)